ncbi:unnamed protein product [Peronospora farinosa]|uniref:RING-type E3 ubiquitin transferase BRCA1 n=1 Tax=Peronospora farinosa TaxID=134698 RepID=A0AAV0THX6_9STRA|nr:unnamed protein product [Peronospora farinosa]CAI5720423.1 unnamed protein product [Peronospora farinosa]
MDRTPWTLTRLQRAVENFSAQLLCAICLCAYDSPVSLPCNHCFCEECIHRALELKALCPICKTPAKKRRLRYDTTVRELLRATEILCAAPAMKTEDERAVEESKTSKVAGPNVADSLEQHTLPRRGKRNLRTTNSTLMDVWMDNGHSQVNKNMKLKQEKVSSPRRSMEKMDSLLSPAIFDGRTLSRSKLDGMNGNNGTLCTIENGTQFKDAELKNVVAVGDVVVDTEVELVKQEEQKEKMLTRRRSSTDGEVVVIDETQVEIDQSRQLQSTASQAPIGNGKAGQLMLQTPTPRSRRRSATNGIKLDAAVSKTLKKVAVSNGNIACTNGVTTTLSLDVDSQMQPLSHVESEVFQVGDVVEVIERQWVGINKQGGAARITKFHGDGFYAVKFVIGGKDNRVPGTFIRRPAEELISDSTPSRSAKKRQRQRVSDKMNTPDRLATKTTGSTDSMKAKSKTKRKRSDMVFLCSGFKDRRMQQIEEWANLLGAEVVQYWSNDVTHLIVECVSKDDAENEGPLIDDSDSTPFPQSHQNENRGLFGGPKSGRWVKIRSLKYLQALVCGRWIVSEEWLQACAEHGGYVKEVNYEADGHWKGTKIHDAVKRSRLTREKLLQLSSPEVDRSTVGTMLFADFCFHIIGEFLPPMPSATDLKTLICMGGGELIALIPDETYMRDKRARKLIVVSDKINPVALRQQTKQLKAQPEMKAVSSAIIVNYLWVINSISEANLRELP